MHNRFWQGRTGAALINFLCFIFTILVHCMYSTIKVCNYYFVFISLIFIFLIILQSFKGTPLLQLLPGAITWRGINTEKSVIRRSKLKGQKPPFWIIVNLQVSDEAGQASFYVFISKREKVAAQPIISYMVCLIMTDMSFGLRYW